TCGNANDDPNDDDVLTSPQVALELGGLSLEVAKDNRGCSESCGAVCRRCRQRQGVMVEEEEEKTSCWLIAQRPGPFERCHSTIDPTNHVKNCLYDVCMANGLRGALCQALQVYADNCQEEGVEVADWRTPARCPLTCPENSKYSPCGTSCPTTCNADAGPPACNTSTCVETCECHQGFVFDADRCVPGSQCGCVFQDLLHGLHEEFWGDTTCTKRCVCDGTTRRAKCHRASCRPGEECRVEEGVQDCYAKSYGTCAATGATHYETFDGGRFIFQGTCFYQLAGLCQESQDLENFQVLVQNGHQEDEEVLSSIAVVVVKVYEKTIAISRERPGKVMVDDQLVNLPYHHPDGKVSTSRAGQEAVVATDFGLTVTYDWKGQVTIQVPSTYSTTLCGLCGNFNGNAGDDMMTKGDQLTSNPDTFGHSWKVGNLPACLEMSMVECPTTTPQQQKVGKMSCGVILEEGGPFGACHAHVDAGKFFQSCLHDFCLFPRREDATCAVIAGYAAACQAAGVTIGRWRRDDFCNLPCPANSHYEICSQGCSQTCGGASTHGRCSERCREGCACDDGFVLSGDECVPASRCGCTHQGFYYKLEETFYPTKKEKCHCQAGGTVSCQASCPGDEEGEVINGVFKCRPAALGTCKVIGDCGYVTFDGVAFNISGTCSYILAETCSGGDVQPFVVKIQKEARQKKKVSGVQVLTVEVYGLTLTLRRGKRGAVMVDSISHHLPVILSGGKVQVHQEGMGVLLQTDFGLAVRYDLLHHVTVAAPRGHRGHLCGLCGNFNGQGGDDFLLLGGQEAPNAAVFGSSWRTPDASCNNDDCPKGFCPTCAEEKKVVFQKRNYCGFLKLPKGPLASCHPVVDPTQYFQSCLHDLCLANGDTRVLCQSIQSYAGACQAAGVAIKPWRRPSFCPLTCPANSSYALRADLCLNGCAGLVDASSCPKTKVEGCQCHEGHVFEVHGCVPKGQCGCFVDGRYYKLHESVLKDKCQQRCTCDPTQGLVCTSHSCTDDETCEVQDGTLRC
ncbi:FCGBP protein, partial [Crotophaga sulcirostris]|nr:FCGBP protein [Crotophaga sulcirostris]